MSIVDSQFFETAHVLAGSPECTVYHRTDDGVLSEAEMLGLSSDTETSFTAPCVYSPKNFSIASTDSSGRILSVRGLEVLVKLETGQSIDKKDLITLPSDSQKHAIRGITVDGQLVNLLLT
jgi:hypothetical protein